MLIVQVPRCGLFSSPRVKIGYRLGKVEVGEREGLEDPHSRAPAVVARIDDDLVGEGIGFAGGDGRDVVFFAVDGGDDLHGGFEEHGFHGFVDFGAFCAI